MAELKRLRELEAENAKLKRMYADLALENTAIKDVLSRKLTPSARREAIRVMTKAGHRLGRAGSRGDHRATGGGPLGLLEVP